MNRLQKNVNYNLLVKSITLNRRQFPRGGNTCYVHDVYFDAGNGDQAVGEYITTSPGQSYFQQGEMACFIVGYDGGKGVEIEPCAVPSSMKSTEPGMIEREFVAVAGDSHNFAMRYATDIICARINSGLGDFNPEKDIAVMTGLASKINKWLIDPQDPLPF